MSTRYVGRDFDPANPTESEVFSMDFANELATGELITSVSTNLTVFQGVDANPSSHLTGSPAISGSVVSQRVANMLAGVTYTISYTVTTSVTTSLTKQLTLYSRIACRPVQ